MDSLKWPLFFVCLCFEVVQAEDSSWTAEMPSSVHGLLGSCVVIPCTFNYPDPGKVVSDFTGIWIDGTHELIYHPVESKIMQQYRNRTKLLGDVTQRSCSLKIDPLQRIDQGPFHFRIEIANYENFSYKKSTASITVISEPNAVSLSVKEEVVEGQTVTASCSVSHSCPASPPVFTWSRSGREHVQPQQLQDGQWKATSTLTFYPTSADHNKPLLCTVTYRGGKQQNKAKVLKVKYTPVKVHVEFKSDVKEGEAVQLKCSSDANPPASSYEWHNETGARLHQGNVYRLLNVSRHTGALYCTAINTVGRGKSSPVHLNVLHAPEIKAISSCSSEAYMVKCVCIAESKPPSMVYFVLSDRVLPGTKVEKHGSVTIGTLRAEFGSSEFVSCLANNTQGIAKLTLSVPAYNKMHYLYIAIVIAAIVILVIILTVVGVKKWGRSGDVQTSHMSTGKLAKDVKLPQYAATQRKEKNNDVAQCPNLYAQDHVYGNMENDYDDAIYANV